MGVISKTAQNPIPAILAETFSTLNACKEFRKGKMGKIRCCLPLLFMWATTYLMDEVSYEKWHSLGDSLPDSHIKKYVTRLPKLNKGIQEWIKYLLTQNEKPIWWRSFWKKNTLVLVACGDYAFIPLAGPWHGMSYAPLYVLRQFGTLQFEPLVNGLELWEYDSESHNKWRMIDEFERAWSSIQKVKNNLGAHKVTKGYQQWRSEAIRHFSFPTAGVQILEGEAREQPDMRMHGDTANRYVANIHETQLLLETNKRKLEVLEKEAAERDRTLRHCRREYANLAGEMKRKEGKDEELRQERNALQMKNDSLQKEKVELSVQIQRDNLVLQQLRAQNEHLRRETANYYMAVQLLRNDATRASLIPMTDHAMALQDLARLIQQCNDSIQQLRQYTETPMPNEYAQHIQHCTGIVQAIVRSYTRVWREAESFTGIIRGAIEGLVDAIRPEYMNSPIREARALFHSLRRNMASTSTEIIPYQP